MRNRLLSSLLLFPLLACGPEIEGEDEVLSDEAGLATGTGLTGRYFKGQAFETFVAERIDAQVNFNWDTGGPLAATGVDQYSVRWTGQLEAPVTGRYTFTTRSDDGVRLSISGTSRIDNWTLHAAAENTAQIDLVAGQRYDVTMEYYEAGGRAVAELSWSYPGQAKQLIPRARLYPVAAPPPTTMKTFLGSTHNHTGVANNHGDAQKTTTAEIFALAKANGFDFIFLTEHSGKTGPASVPMDPAAFYADVKRQVANYTDSSFVGVPGFEFSDNDAGEGLGKGHMTIANTDAFVSADGAASNSKTIEDYLVSQAAAGRPAYGGFNHPGEGGHPGSVVSLLTPARRERIVMSEIHNSYASQADDRNFTGLISELDRGWRVAPVCGLDGHGAFRIEDRRPEPGPCRTGILAPSLSKANLDAAFLARRIYSSRDINMQVRYTANGSWMGSIIGTPATVNFDVTVSDPDTSNAADKIKKIEILTERGAIVATKAFDAHSVNWKVAVPANGKKYFLVRIFNGERSTYTAAAAPVWLE